MVMSADPWKPPYYTYTSDDEGVAHVELSVSDFSLEGTRPVAGRTMVVHLSNGNTYRDSVAATAGLMEK